MSNTKKFRISYLGPQASFSHQAALAIFPSAELIPHSSFTSIFNALQDSSCSNNSSSTSAEPKSNPTEQRPTFAIVPIENSTNGSVVQVLDLLAACSISSPYPDLEVVGEYYLPVHHYLYTNSNATNHDRSISTTSTPNPSPLLTPLSAIKTLYTHPQVWTQCSTYLTTHFPHTERIDVSSTSAGAGLVSKDSTGTSAAICSSLAGQLFSLDCLASRIEDDEGGNTTRFFVLRNRRTSPSFFKSDDSTPEEGQEEEEGEEQGQGTPNGISKNVNIKALLLFTIVHTLPGSLSKALDIFAKHGLNLTRIDTRPSRQRSWHYVFFVECEERLRSTEDEESKLRGAIKELEAVTESVNCLGRWIDMVQF